ncbi:MAG TPA: pyridoxamine 5'-phosphate oxidase family protein [Streptosporangiaceae bacterium]|jgi:hypothetical protein
MFPPDHLTAPQLVLAGGHAGMLSVIESAERAPLVAPAWYSYDPGGVVRFTTEPDTRALEAVRRSGRATLSVQDAYGFVAVEGTMLISEPTDPAEFRQWAVWCLGADLGERYYRSAEDALEWMTTVRLVPQVWHGRAAAFDASRC